MAGGCEGGTVTLTIPSFLQVWADQDRSDELDNILIFTLPAGGVLSETVYVEPIAPSENGGMVTASMSTPGCNVSDQAKVRVWGLENMTFSPNPLPADRKSKSQASVTIHPGDHTVTWSIVGDARGATIDAQTGIITAGCQSGIVIVRATDADHPECYLDGELELGACEGGCVRGSANPELGSIRVRWNTGRKTEGWPVGHLLLSAQRPSRMTASRAHLRYHTAPISGELDVIRADGKLRQIKSGEGLIDLVDVTEGYAIRVYDEAVVGPVVNGLYTLINQPTPQIEWEVLRLAAPLLERQLLVRKLVDGVEHAAYRYSFKRVLTKKHWKLEVLNGSAVERTEKIDSEIQLQSGGLIQVRTHEISGPLGVAYKEAYERPLINKRRVKVKQIVDPDGAGLTTIRSYYPDADGARGRLKSLVGPDGGWSYYEYDAQNRPLRVYSPGENEPLGAGPNPAIARCTEYSYLPVDGADSGFVFDRVPRTITDRVGSIVVGKQYYACYLDGNQNIVEIAEACPTVGAAYGAGNLRSQTTSDGVDPNDILEIRHADGRLDTFVIEQGALAINYSDPGTAVFTPGAGLDRRVVVTHGTIAAPTGIADQSTREVTISNAFGRTLISESYACDDPGVFARIGWVASQYDDQGRQTHAYTSNNTSSASEWGCCYLTAVEDASGVRTTQIPDVLGRPIIVTKTGVAANGSYPSQEPIVTTTVYDAADQVLTSTVSGGGLSLTTSAQFDLAGRIDQSTDAASLVTDFDYETLSGGGRRTFVTPPGNPTVITEYALDGSPKSVTGDHVVQQHYQFGVNPDGTQWSTVFVGPLGTESPRWSKRTVDALGRPIREERPLSAAAGQPTGELVTQYFYDDANGGRLRKISVSEPAGQIVAATLYEYDALGRPIRTGLDLDNNGTLDNASTDRITETKLRFVQIAGSWYEETEQLVYATDNSATPTTVRKERRRLTGFSAPRVAESVALDPYNNETVTFVEIDTADRRVTQTTDFPASGNNASQVSRNGLPQNSTDKAQLATTYTHDALGRPTRTTDSRGVWT